MPGDESPGFDGRFAPPYTFAPMARIREIKKRMNAVRNIQRITKTMQMIATAKFTSAYQRTKATQPYARKIRQMVADVAAAAGDVDHPLLAAGREMRGRELLLVICSDRGLCGAFNSNLLRRSLNHIRQAKSAGRETVLETSGKKATAFFRFANVPVSQRHTQFGDKPKYEDARALAERYVNEFIAGEYDAVRVAFTRFVSNSRQTPDVIQLLPLAAPVADPNAARKAEPLYEFSPSSAELLATLLPESVKTTLFQCFNESVVSEHMMRKVAMKAATDNARELGKTLRRSFNRARQSQITTELMEVIAGAAALE